MTARFGRRLYDVFFRSYTEKVWGIPGSEIRAEWAAQRIKNFSLAKALSTILGLRRPHVTTLIEEFHYPRLGPGQMWEALAERLEASGVPVRTATPCTAIRHSGRPCQSVIVASNGGVEGASRRLRCSRASLWAISSSSSILRLLRKCVAAAGRLRYRQLCLVALVTTRSSRSPTTGSTSTTPAREQGVCRTSARGARAWSCRARPASASSTSASRATTSGNAGGGGRRAGDARARADRSDRPVERASTA